MYCVQTGLHVIVRPIWYLIVSPSMTPLKVHRSEPAIRYPKGEVSVVFNFCAALLSRLFPSEYHTQRALQWWHQRQVNRLHDGAELIRDGILQELFAIRRMLELARDRQEPVSQASLRQLEVLHLRLERVSNQLSPAFIRDSLPLAIQHVLREWQLRYPAVKLSTQLPQGDFREPTLASRVAFTTFEELLFLVSNKLEADASVAVNLVCHDNTATLTVHINNLDCHQCRAIAQLKELSHLRQSFQFLTNGDMTQAVHESWVQWQMSWSTFNPSYC